MYYVSVDRLGRHRWMKSKSLPKNRTPGSVIAQSKLTTGFGALDGRSFDFLFDLKTSDTPLTTNV